MTTETGAAATRTTRTGAGAGAFGFVELGGDVDLLEALRLAGEERELATAAANCSFQL